MPLRFVSPSSPRLSILYSPNNIIFTTQVLSETKPVNPLTFLPPYSTEPPLIGCDPWLAVVRTFETSSESGEPLEQATHGHSNRLELELSLTADTDSVEEEALKVGGGDGSGHGEFGCAVCTVGICEENDKGKGGWGAGVRDGGLKTGGGTSGVGVNCFAGGDSPHLPDQGTSETTELSSTSRSN